MKSIYLFYNLFNILLTYFNIIFSGWVPKYPPPYAKKKAYKKNPKKETKPIPKKKQRHIKI
jgi:hypothetical protein